MSAQSSLIRVLLAVAITTGIAHAGAAVMTGFVDTESADNGTGFHVGDKWTWTMVFNSAGLDSFSALGFPPSVIQPNVLYDLTIFTDCPCPTQILFEGPADIPLDFTGIDMSNGVLTRLFFMSGSLNMHWNGNNPDNRWDFSFSGTELSGVSGPITSARLVPEPATSATAALALVLGALSNGVGANAMTRWRRRRAVRQAYNSDARLTL